MVGGSNPPRVVSFAHFLYFVLMIFWYFSDISYLSLELITGYLPCLLFVLSCLYYLSALLQVPRTRTNWSYCGWMFMSSLPSSLLFFLLSTPPPLSVTTRFCSRHSKLTVPSRELFSALFRFWHNQTTWFQALDISFNDSIRDHVSLKTYFSPTYDLVTFVANNLNKRSLNFALLL